MNQIIKIVKWVILSLIGLAGIAVVIFVVMILIWWPGGCKTLHKFECGNGRFVKISECIRDDPPPTAWQYEVYDKHRKVLGPYSLGAGEFDPNDYIVRLSHDAQIYAITDKHLSYEVFIPTTTLVNVKII